MKYLLSILILVVAFSTVYAQAPHMLNYQGVARNTNGTPLNNQAIKLRLSVQSAGGNAFYVESHSPTTNAFGLYALQIGQGTVISGNFSNIDWAQNKTFLKVEIDPTGGNNYTPVGSPAQLISVPYALEAEHAASTELGGDVTGNSTFSTVTGLQGRPVDAGEPNTGDVLKWNGSEWTPASGGGGGAYNAGSGISISGNTIYNTGDLDEYNELQSISLVGNTLTLSDGGGSVTLPGGGGGGSFSLPYTGTQNNSNSLFNITNTGSGGAIHAVSNNGSGPLGAAVYGSNTSPDGMGVWAAGDFIGVYGFSDSGFGVFAESTNGTAISAASGNGTGIDVSSYNGTALKAKNFGLDPVVQLTANGTGAALYIEGSGFEGAFIDGSYDIGIITRGTTEGIEAQSDHYGGGFYGKDAGVYARSTSPATGGDAGYFDGSLYATTMQKGSGSFKIDHPLDPENKFLYHSFVESPDMMNVYNGNVTTDANGQAKIELPAYFEALNRDFRYQLTCIGTFAQVIVEREVDHNSFSIRSDKPNVKVSWQVTGIRQDSHADRYRIIPEVEKRDNEKGKYLCPECFGQPESKGMKYEDRQKPGTH